MSKGRCRSMRPSAAAAGIIRKRSTKPSRRGSADATARIEDGAPRCGDEPKEKRVETKTFRPFFNALVSCLALYAVSVGRQERGVTPINVISPPQTLA